MLGLRDTKAGFPVPKVGVFCPERSARTKSVWVFCPESLKRVGFLSRKPGFLSRKPETCGFSVPKVFEMTSTGVFCPESRGFLSRKIEPILT